MKATKTDLEKRIEATRLLREEADARAEALIKELTAKHDALASQIKALDKERQDIAFNIAALKGEVEASFEGTFRAKKHHVKDEAILALIASRGKCTTGDIQEHFQFSSATVCRRMDTLLAARRVTLYMEATTKLWKAKKS